MAKSGTKTKKKPDPVDEIEDDDVELDDLDDDVEEEAPKSKKGGAEEVEFGASDLAAHLSKKTGKKITARDLRTLIRKMARDGSGRVDREITAGNRSRYNWAGGLKNPEVKAIIAAVEDGELERGKQEALQALKERKAAKGSKKGKKSKKTKVEVEETEDDEDDELEEDDDE